METSVSLLERLRTTSDEAAWQRLDDIYRPLIRRWLLRYPKLGEEAEDVVQDVMHVLIRELPGFHRQRNGSFRRWLRTITAHRVLAHHRARQSRPQALGLPLEECPLEQLSDPHSELSLLWDQEHDHYVLRRLLELIEPLFEGDYPHRLSPGRLRRGPPGPSGGGVGHVGERGITREIPCSQHVASRGCGAD